MGSVCCVAAKERTIQNTSTNECINRNSHFSPSWSFHWDNRGQVTGGADTPVSWFSDGVIRTNALEVKSTANVDSAYASEVGSPVHSFSTPSHKSPGFDALTENLNAHILDEKGLKPMNIIEKECTDHAEASGLFLSKRPSLSSPSSMSSQGSLCRGGSKPSRQSHSSPGSRAKWSRSPSGELWSNELSRVSHGEYSDLWPLLSSQTGRWSFGSDIFGEKITRSNSQVSASSPLDLQTCGVCMKLISERPSLSTQKVVSNNEISVVSVLVCGHVYHAGCLESMTLEVNKYDPICPACFPGKKQALELCEKAMKEEADPKSRTGKKMRNRVVDSDYSGDFSLQHRKNKGFPKMGPSSSVGGSLGKPFLRHFSFGSKMTENHSSRKKGFFWSRSSKE